MLIFLSLTFLLGISMAMPQEFLNNAQPDEKCKNCIDLTTKLFELFASQRYQKFHENLFIEKICSQLKDQNEINECSTFVTDFWIYLGPKGLFTSESAKEFCSDAEEWFDCDENRDWDCENCENDLIHIALAYKSPEAIESIVTGFQTEFCEHEDLKLEGDALIECKSNMEEFMPEATKLIFNDVINKTEITCKETFNLCHVDENDDNHEDTHDGFDENNHSKSYGEFLQGFYQYLSSEEIIEDQKSLLIKDVCPQMENPELCKMQVESYWQYYSKGIFSNDSATEFCAYFSCDKDSNWDCDVCKYDVDVISNALITEESIKAYVGGFSVEICEKSEEIDTEDKINACKTYMQEFLPIAMKAILNQANCLSGEICNDIFLLECDQISCR